MKFNQVVRDDSSEVGLVFVLCVCVYVNIFNFLVLISGQSGVHSKSFRKSIVSFIFSKA